MRPAPCQLRENVPLAPLTTWRIGGPARWLAEPSAAEVPALLEWARAEKLRVWWLGRGSNVLVDDAGLDGLVVLTREAMKQIGRKGDCIEAEAGVSLPRLAKFAAQEGYAGYEFLIGIPGTVGAAVAINAGFKQGDPRHMLALVHEADLIALDGSTRTVTMQEVNARYRYTDILETEELVLRARLKLERPGDPEEIRAETREHLLQRKRTQPLTRPTAGSVFKAIHDGTPAAVFIDRAGLKGLQEGGAIVSPKHANWIENAGGASARDVLRLVEQVQRRVGTEFGLDLEPEIRYLHSNA
ncbi:MAG: UDP-N-acetylmuramate dehydrogenase [Verrucomicrobiota bacterium JB022]|nr:UDP-N-acetylmuramate dehydrogenase [Verrucomicrobiota bacterium JB022]